MKTIGARICAVAMACLSLGMASANTFTNGDFEAGTDTGWTTGGGLWSAHPGWPQNFNDYTDPAQYKGAIVTPGPDPIIGSALNQVYAGSYAMRVNDSTPNYHVSTLKQTIVNYTDTNMFFAWAAVLQASHGATDSDNFTLKLTDDTAGTDLVVRTYSSFNAGPIFTLSGSGGWLATPWQVEQLDVSASVGHTFTLSVLASDCAQGGHGGYIYVDSFGPAAPVPTPAAATVTVAQVTSGSGTTYGSGVYDIGTNVTISVVPNSGWRFRQWDDGDTNSSRSITVGSNVTYTATLYPIITVTPGPSEGGTIIGGGDYPIGSNATLTVVRSNGWRFVDWNDGNTNTSRTIAVSTPATYSANFVPWTSRLFFQDLKGTVANWQLDHTGARLSANLIAEAGGWILKTAGDVNGDGMSDLIFETEIGQIGIWLLNTNANFSSAAVLGTVNPAWQVVACGDYVGTGVPQIFFQTADGKVAYWNITSSGAFVNSVLVSASIGEWVLKYAVDVDGDGKADLIWQRADGMTAIWTHGAGSAINAQLLGNVGGWQQRAGVNIDGDVLNTGDLLWQTSTGQIGMWFMNTNLTASSAEFMWLTLPGWKLKAAGLY